MMHISDTRKDPTEYHALTAGQLLDMFEQESYYTRLDSKSNMRKYNTLRTEIMRRIRNGE